RIRNWTRSKNASNYLKRVSADLISCWKDYVDGTRTRGTRALRCRSLASANSTIKTVQRSSQAGKIEGERLFEQPPRHTAPARKRQPPVAAHQPRADPNCPSRRRRAPEPMQHLPQFAHELSIRDRLRPGSVENALHSLL